MIQLHSKDFLKLYRCKDFAPFLIFLPHDVVKIDFEKLPRTHIIEPGGDSALGLALIQKLNHVHRETGLLKIEIVMSPNAIRISTDSKPTPKRLPIGSKIVHHESQWHNHLRNGRNDKRLSKRKKPKISKPKK